MKRRLAALLLTAAMRSAFAGEDAPQPFVPPALRLSERLATAPIATSEPLAEAEPESIAAPPQKRARLRRKLALTATLAGWSGTRSLDDAHFVAVPRLAVDAGAGLPLRFSAALLADAAREQASRDEDSRTRATLREAWLGWKHGATTARLGWQIVNWGRTDVLNPTDNASARDYTRLVDRDADQKLGVPMLNLIERFDALSVQALWQPLFRASAVPLARQPGLRIIDEKPRWTPGSGGLRIDAVGEHLSGALSYLRGPGRLPNAALSLPRLALGALSLTHPMTEVLGADAEALLGSWVLRGESAWQRVRGSGGDALASRESFVESVLGIERAFGEASAFLQAEHRHTFDWIDPRAQPVALQPLALTNASLNDELHRSRTQLGGGFALNTADLRWSASFDFAYVLGDGDWVFRPRLRWRLDDRVQLLAGADWFRGPEYGAFGRLRRASAAFVGLSASWSRDG